MLTVCECGKGHISVIFVARSNFSCTLLAILKAILKAKIGGNKFMKIATRLLVLTLVLSAAGVSQTSKTGPGPVPYPPVTVAR